jgi:TetR/AcrR family hemagglutinin/protease transcriptional regulator
MRQLVKRKAKRGDGDPDVAFVAHRAIKLPVKERRAQLLASALRVFARKGLASAGHADVATAAGVAVPTVFDYFPTRSDLVVAVVNEVGRFILVRARAAASSKPTVSKQLIAILRDFTASCDTHREYAAIWVNWGASLQEDVWPLYSQFVEGTIKLHRDIIEAGRKRGELLSDVDPEMSAYLFIGAATMIIQMKKEQRDPRSIARYLETIIHGALHQR